MCKCVHDGLGGWWWGPGTFWQKEHLYEVLGEELGASAEPWEPEDHGEGLRGGAGADPMRPHRLFQRFCVLSLSEEPWKFKSLRQGSNLFTL